MLNKKVEEGDCATRVIKYQIKIIILHNNKVQTLAKLLRISPQPL